MTPRCRNPMAGEHGCHPLYAKKYDGYCLDCSNAGVPELVEALRPFALTQHELDSGLEATTESHLAAAAIVARADAGKEMP